MPLDNSRFEPVAAALDVRCGGLCAALRSALGRLARLFRPPPEPLDTAVLRVLEEARGLIAEREDWRQGSYETLRGERCAVGALRLAADYLDYRAAGLVAQDMLTLIALSRGYRDIETMNDHSRHESVLAAFDEAIAAARGAD
jgi:hypothetical protein